MYTDVYINMRVVSTYASTAAARLMIETVVCRIYSHSYAYMSLMCGYKICIIIHASTSYEYIHMNSRCIRQFLCASAVLS